VKVDFRFGYRWPIETNEMKNSNNGRTVAAYENYARRYAANVAPPSGSGASALRRLAEMLPSGGHILDIGSGPGWDADFLEGLGLRVHRTDVTRSFRDFQAERGQQVDALDLLTDRIAGTYDGILMLCVLQHFERTELNGVLRKLVDALKDQGAMLLSYPVGEDEAWENTASGDYRVVRWPDAALDERLRLSGFVVVWEHSESGDEGPWRTVLARKTQPAN
jgi:2-polyprenyl-3-methyl-5-hydroxy-6-metoxy-1,4-benzoquinol methylase